jgi:mannose-1-phosphate guanylyltransferase
VILAGGAGERFWPRSRASHPKPLIRLLGGRSLLEATVARARRVAGERVWLVCGHEHAVATRRQARLPASRVLVEPRRRNTAMAVAFAATRIAARDPEALMAVLPADHHIPDAHDFARHLRRAARAAEEGDALVTLGLEPTRPETGYGYIRLGDPVGRGQPGVHRVRRFVEKPGAAQARRYLRSGNHLWNAGIFIWKVQRILQEIETHAPALHAALAPLRESGRSRRQAVERAYGRAPSLPIDTAVLERSRRVWCLPAGFAWSDLGTWESLAEAVGVSPDVTQVIDGESFLYDAPGNLVWGAGRPVALLGVEGLAVIDAGDALLVAKLDRSSEMRELVSLLRGRRRTDLL